MMSVGLLVAISSYCRDCYTCMGIYFSLILTSKVCRQHIVAHIVAPINILDIFKGQIEYKFSFLSCYTRYLI